MSVRHDSRQLAGFALAAVMIAGSLCAQSQADPPGPAPTMAPATPAKSWTTSLGAGYTLSKGNSNSSNPNVSFNTLWDPKTVRTFKSEFLYIEETRDNEETVDKSTALVRYEQHAGAKNHYWFIETSYSRDSFKDIAFLVSPRLGIGMNLSKSDRLKLSLDLSAGTATERDLGGETSTGGAVQLGQTLDIALGGTKISQKSSALFKSGDFNDTIYHVDVGVTSSVVHHIDVKFTYIFEYKTQPDAGDVLNSDTSVLVTLLLKW